MPIIAPIEDGKVVDYKKKETNEMLGKAQLGYDQFLQLLCAEMQYQDPLEPTSNTDYVAQLATFSQLEATLSQTESIEDQTDSITESTITQQLNFANSLVGKEVILAMEDGSYVTGKVDYIAFEEGQIMLAVDDKLYALDTLDTIADQDYYDAVTLANTFGDMLKTLPALNEIDSSYKTMVQQLVDLYDGMSSYEQSFIDDDQVHTLRQYQVKMEELAASEDEAGTENVETEE